MASYGLSHDLFKAIGEIAELRFEPIIRSTKGCQLEASLYPLRVDNTKIVLAVTMAASLRKWQVT